MESASVSHSILIGFADPVSRPASSAGGPAKVTEAEGETSSSQGEKTSSSQSTHEQEGFLSVFSGEN